MPDAACVRFTGQVCAFVCALALQDKSLHVCTYVDIGTNKCVSVLPVVHRSTFDFYCLYRSCMHMVYRIEMTDMQKPCTCGLAIPHVLAARKTHG